MSHSIYCQVQRLGPCTCGADEADWELVGYFMEDGGRWLKMDNIYADDPDAVPLYRKRIVGVGDKHDD